MPKDPTFICKDCKKEFRCKAYPMSCTQRSQCPQCYTKELMNNMCIVLFDDNRMQIFNTIQDKDNFIQGSRFFTCKEDTTISDISMWVGQGYEHSRIKEIV